MDLKHSEALAIEQFGKISLTDCANALCMIECKISQATASLILQISNFSFRPFYFGVVGRILFG